MKWVIALIAIGLLISISVQLDDLWTAVMTLQAMYYQDHRRRKDDDETE